MVFDRLAVLNAFLIYNIFNLCWVYQDKAHHKSRMIFVLFFFNLPDFAHFLDIFCFWNLILC